MLESSGELSQSARSLLRDMERYAGGTRCRHRMLVEHFGQRHEGTSCDACDWCLHELEPVDDAATLAQKILSAVARLRQRWGVGHVIDVLRGRETERITARKHDQLSTFGLLSETPLAELRGYVDQLTAQGFLMQTGDQYPVLRLTDDGLAALRAERTLVLFPAAASRPAPRPEARRRGDIGVCICVGVVLGGSRYRVVRGVARVPTRDCARPQRAAVRRVSRHNVARTGPPSSIDAGATPRHPRDRDAQSGGPGSTGA